MKIIMVHNRYQYQGGEDSVFQLESEMLSQHGHSVEQLVFDNKEIQNSMDKFLLSIKGIYNSKSGADLARVINRFKPDVIHVHNFFPLASPSIFFVAKKYGIPVVVTLHNFRLICPSATLYHNNKIYEKNIHSLFPWDGVWKGVYRKSKLQTAGLAVITAFHNIAGTWKNKIDKFIVLTQFAKQKFTDSALRVSESQFVVKPNFVDDYGKNENKREDFFLIVGRLSEEKGIDTLLKAVTLADFKLVIIGDGPLKDRVEAATQSNSNITYLGFQQKPAIVDYLKRCKALIFPSVCYEGFSMTLLEAFSTGAPVISSRIGSMAEIVRDHENGLHFEAGNALDLVDKIRLLNGDQSLSELLSNNARQTYLGHYTSKTNYKILIDIYSQLLSSKEVSH